MAAGRDNPGSVTARRDAMTADEANGHSGRLIVVERPSAAITAAAHQARNGRNAVARRPRWRTTGQNSLVGSAARINLGDRRQVRRSRAHRQDWQTEAWDYWDEIGELRYVTSYMANLISKLRLYPAVDSPDGPVAVDSDTGGEEHQAAAEALQAAGVTPAVATLAVETLARLRSVQGGQSAMLRELALNLDVAGECSLHGHAEPVDSTEPGNPTVEQAPVDLAALGEPPDNTADPATIEDWNVRSIDELISTGDRFELRLGPGSKTGDSIPDTDLVIRIWERHPRYSEQASCAMRSVLGECEALLLLSREIRATAKSRLSNGILLIPSELSFGSIDPTTDPGDGEEEEDPFDAELQESMITPIMEEGSASAVVPLVLRGPAELLQHVNHLAIDKALDPVLDARIEQRILRIGRGLNMPTETTTGFMATTFANASAIKRSEYEDHVEPRATLIVDALTNGYFQWALEMAGVDGEIARNIFVWFDPSALLIVEDMSEQAVEAHKDGVISDAARRKYQGFKEEDAPDADELARRVVLHGGRIDPTIFGYLVKQALDDENLPIPAPPAGILGVAESVSAAPVPGAPPETDVTVGGAPLEPIAEPAPEPPPAPALPPGVPPPTAEPAPGTPPPPEPKPAEPVAAAATPRNRDAEWKKLGRTLAGIDRELRTRITAKLDQAMSTALDKAGARIRTRIQRDKGGEKSILAKSVETTPRRQIASQLGKQVVDQTGLSDEQLVHGEFETALDDINLWMGLTYDRAMRAVERVAGPPTAARRQERDARHTRDRARAISWLRDNLHQLAGARLYSPTPTMPPTGEHDGTVLIPASLVRAAVAVAGGATPRGGTGDTTVAVASAWVDIGGAGPVTDENGDPLGGIGTGPNVMGAAGDGGGQTEGYQWEYGEGLRSEFIPHVDLDGITVSEPDQFEWGANYEGFPEVDVPFPGDHEGCVCDLTPVLIGPDESTRTETPEDLLAQDEQPLATSESFDASESLTSDERSALRLYESAAYQDLNGILRGTLDPSEWDYSRTLAEQTQLMDSAIAKSTVNADVTVLRGINSDFIADRAVGAMFVDPTYASATTSQANLESFLRRAATEKGEATTLRVSLPAGTHALPLASSTENEVLLPRGAAFTITKSESNTLWVTVSDPTITKTGEEMGWSNLNPSAFADRLGYTRGTADISEADLKEALGQVAEARNAVRAAGAALEEDTLRLLEGLEGAGRYSMATIHVNDPDYGALFRDISDTERSRLRQNWQSKTTKGLGWDELTETISTRIFHSQAGTGIDEQRAFEWWLEQTRIADAAKAISNGRTINSDRYGYKTLNEIIDSPYNLTELFGRKDQAAAEIARVHAGATTDQARDLLGYGATGPSLGPAPWEMTQTEYVNEAERLDDLLANVRPTEVDTWGDAVYSAADQRTIERMAELLPSGIDDPENPVSFNELYRQIIELARSGALI